MVVKQRGDRGSFKKERKKEAHNAMCKNSTEENKRRHKSMKNKAKKAV